MTEIKSISAPTLISSRFRCPDTKTEVISIQRPKTSHFRPPHKNQANSDPTLKRNQFRPPTQQRNQYRPPTQQPNQFRPPTQQPNQFYPYAEIKSISIHRTKIKAISINPEIYKSIEMHTQKPSHFQPAHSNQVSFDHPHNELSESTPTPN